MLVQEEAVVQEHEESFPEADSNIINTMDVTRALYAIRAVEKRVNYLKLQDQDSRSFYASRITKHQEQIDVLKQSVLAYLQHRGMKKIQTPAGTAFQKTSTKRIWPDDEELVGWAMISKPDAIRIIRQVDKRMAAEYIRSTGEAPDGYAETEQISLCIR